MNLTPFQLGLVAIAGANLLTLVLLGVLVWREGIRAGRVGEHGRCPVCGGRHG